MKKNEQNKKAKNRTFIGCERVQEIKRKERKNPFINIERKTRKVNDLMEKLIMRIQRLF